MNINDLTIGQAKELASIFVSSNNPQSCGLNSMVGKKVIVRTLSAGVWFGKLEQKYGKEVIITNARRMYQWWAKDGTSLSAVALYGIEQYRSKIVEPVPSVWIEAIELIPCSDIAIKDLEEAPNVETE